MHQDIDITVGFTVDTAYITTDPGKINIPEFSKKLADWLSEEQNISEVNKMLNECKKESHYVQTFVSYLYYEKNSIKKIRITIAIDKKAIIQKEIPVSYYDEDGWFEVLGEIKQKAMDSYEFKHEVIEQPLPPYVYYTWPEDTERIEYIIESAEDQKND